MEISEKFCPVCKRRNEPGAVICQHCGASLEKLTVEGPAVTRETGAEVGDPDVFQDLRSDETLIPAGGIAIFAAGESEPMFLSSDDEFIIGRKMDESPEVFLDLSNAGGYLLGVSRRHAKVRRNENGYEIIDLSSTNGTWLNGERLIPNKSYLLTSGSRLRLARMQFFILYRSFVNVRQNS